jgi:hypothetical protein
MAEQPPDQQQQQAPNAAILAWPRPPPFWENFTTENIDRYNELRHVQATLEDKPNDQLSLQLMRLLDLPPELRNLQSPNPPADGKYMVFGNHYTVRGSRKVMRAKLIHDSLMMLYLRWKEVRSRCFTSPLERARMPDTRTGRLCSKEWRNL